MSEITLEEFRRDIRRQKREKKIRTAPKESWKNHPEALNRGQYYYLTNYGKHQLKRPRPVWLADKRRWTVGPPVNPVEWQILIQSEPRRGQPGRRVGEIRATAAIKQTCGQFQMSRYKFSEYTERLIEKNLLRCGGGFRRSKIVVKWLFPDMTGGRAGGEWHRKHVHAFIDETNFCFGCFTYADRGFYPGVKMPDVIIVRPLLVEYVTRCDSWKEPIWDFENPVYAEFKSARDMREHPSRLKNQLEQYEGIPLYLEVEAKVWETKDTLKDYGRREVGFLDLIKKADGDMVYLSGSERPRGERSFETVLEKIKDAFRETYDKKARLKKTGTDPEGRECHELILYDSLGTPKNVGQVIPNYADDVEDFADLYFGRERLGRVATADHVYVPERKPTYENKTWAWEKRKTKGSKFRSFTP